MVVGENWPDVVELKVDLDPEQARDAGIWDAAVGRGLSRRIWFCERPGASPVRLPLLDSGVILRLRETRARPDETTARLRPCRRSRLTADWFTPPHTGSELLDCVSDWCGDRRCLSVSVTARHPAGTIARALAEGAPPGRLFTATQRKFLTACADRPVLSGPGTVLGPVHVRRWPALVWCRIPVSVERWAVTGASGVRLDIVELSRRVERQGAEIAQLALESGLRRRGIEPGDAGQGSKTRRFLELLEAARWGTPG
ncbi:hypothetical protein [Streptomyces sp. NPDC016845]|uniref:hypothetical protein n=1 Tax=Streptomyces sp. NPDC016845 TaxID=3364972 RepID=UPI0037BC3EB8